MRRALLLPVVFITYSLAYLDRANYGFGAAAGLAQTLGITESRSALLGALFFLGYFAFQVPGMLLARRVSSTRLAFFALLAWGALAALTGVIHSFAWLALDRLLLGVAESVIFPAMLLLLTRWFTRAERSRANTILMLGNPVTVLWMSILTGFLIQRFGWQRTFIVEGLPAILWAFFWLAVVHDTPAEAPWVPADEVQRLRAAHAASDTLPNLLGASSLISLRTILLSRDVLLLSVHYFFWSLGVYGFVLWLPSIVRRGASLSLHSSSLSTNSATLATAGHALTKTHPAAAADIPLRSMTSTGLLSAIPYLLAIILMLVLAQASDRTLKRQEFVWPPLLLAGLFMLGSFTFAARSFPLAFTCLVLAGACMYAPYGPFFALIPDRVPRQYTGEAFAMINSIGALGGFAGSYLVGLLQALTGNHKASDLLMSLSLIASALLLLLLPKLPAQHTATHS